MNTPVRPVGDLLREWRQRRRMSQLALALEAEVSAKHVSFLESGRASPSREMLMLLADRLDVPLRERNALLLAAGYAPLFPQRSFDDPEMAEVRHAVDLVLNGHEPYPALAIDRHWNLVAHNRMVMPLLDGVDASLLQSPVNVLRLSVHPGGLASRIVNIDEWRSHLFARLRQQIQITADAQLSRLLDELRGYPAPAGGGSGGAGVGATGGGAGGGGAGGHELVYGAASAFGEHGSRTQGMVAVPLQIRAGDHVLSFIGTTTIFGTPVDITLSELAIEAFLPADAATGEILRAMAAALPPR